MSTISSSPIMAISDLYNEPVRRTIGKYNIHYFYHPAKLSW
jgi:hypothetical protein